MAGFNAGTEAGAAFDSQSDEYAEIITAPFGRVVPNQGGYYHLRGILQAECRLGYGAYLKMISLWHKASEN